MDHLQQKKKWKRRSRKAMGVRRRLGASSDHPRLSVFRSSKHMSAQVIDDIAGTTIASASTKESALRDQCAGKTKTECAVIIGTAVAERAKAAGVEAVKFDRSWYLYHGRVKALADAAREAGLKF